LFCGHYRGSGLWIASHQFTSSARAANDPLRAREVSRMVGLALLQPAERGNVVEWMV
jgi:hypothetical protein